jgi:hypothetical protein
VTPEARAAVRGTSLAQAQAFDAAQARTIPSPVVPEGGDLNITGFGYDVFQAGASEAAREMRNTRLQLEAEMRMFFQSNFGYGFR